MGCFIGKISRIRIRITPSSQFSPDSDPYFLHLRPPQLLFFGRGKNIEEKSDEVYKDQKYFFP